MYSQKSTKNNFRVEVLSLLMNPTLDIIALMPYCRYDHAIKSTFKYVAIESGTIGLFKSFRYALFLKILYENAANTYVGFKLFTG